MGTYFQLLGKNGLKLWGTFLLGLFVTWLVDLAVIILLYLVGFGMVFASVGLSAGSLDQAPPEFGVGAILAIILLAIVYYLVYFLTSSFHMAGSYGMVNEAVLDGETAFSTYFSSGIRYFWKIFLQFVIIGFFALLVAVPMIVADVLALVFNDTGDTGLVAVAVIFHFLFLLPLIAYSVAVMFAPVILTAENKGPWESFRLSIRLFRKTPGKVFVTFLLVMAAMLVFLVVYGVMALLMLIPLINGDEGFGAIALLILFILLVLLTFPFLQASLSMIVSLRYKNHLRRFVTPDYAGGGEPGGFDGGPGSGHHHPPAEATDAGQSETPPSSRPPTSYPQFPTDPHMN